MSDILKEAIADAKAVRETALQNAKMALEEAFTPQLKSMLSAKLKEDELEEGDPVLEDEFEDEEEFGGEEEVPEEEPEVPAEEGYYEDEEGGEEEFGGGEEEFGDEEGGEEDMEEEGLDLEAIIRELESELSEDEESQGDTVEEASAEESEEPVSEGDDEVEIDETVLDEDEEEDEDKEDMEEEYDKSSGIGRGDNSVDQVKSSAIGGKSGVETGVKMEAIQSELAEYKQAVTFLKDKLHEVNILNAKLLFTNKLFKEYALDNNQKLKVVETFDRAQTTREIKLVYSTLAEQFGDNSTITKRKSIKESASTAVGSTKPSKGSHKVINEETKVADRFRKLAGILND